MLCDSYKLLSRRSGNRSERTTASIIGWGLFHTKIFASRRNPACVGDQSRSVIPQKCEAH